MIFFTFIFEKPIILQKHVPSDTFSNPLNSNDMTKQTTQAYDQIMHAKSFIHYLYLLFLTGNSLHSSE